MASTYSRTPPGGRGSGQGLLNGGRDNTLEVHNAAGETWAAVSVPPGFSPPDLLLATLIVKHPSGARLTRRPRALIVCERAEEQRALIEADRAQLGHDTVLISHRTIADKVEAVLAASARPGFNRLSTAQGLPGEWCLFTDVQLVGIPATDDETLLPLIPIAWSQIAFGEGLQLPGTLIFHTRDTPELRVSSLDEAETDVQITCLQALDPGFHASSHQLGRISGSGVIPITGLALRDGDYLVELSRHGPSRAATTAGATLRLRSANWPRPLTGPVSWVGTVLGEGVLNPAGAVVLEVAPSGPGVQGARAALPAPATLPVAALPSTLGQLTPPEPEDDMDLAPVSARSTGHVACVVGGAHHWLLPTVGRSGAPKWMKGTGKGCGITRWYPGRPPPRDYVAPPSQPEVIRAAPVAAISPASARPGAFFAPVADSDLLLDALSYARRGTWAAFERLADQRSELPWFALETARTLSALGHIDLVSNPDDLRPQQWAIAPATLATSQDGAFLCGQRSKRLVDAISRRAGELGGTLRVHPQANAPARIAVFGVALPSLARLATQVSQDIGMDLQVDEDPALKLSSALPGIDAVARGLSRFRIPDGAILQRFDFGINTWVEADRPRCAGAYRLHTRPYTYGVLSGTDTLLRADNRWSKWLAAAVMSVNLLAYDPASQQLTCRMGAQMPGLYERAAVLASGWAPQPLTDATVAYRGTPPEVATAIWSALCDHRSS